MGQYLHELGIDFVAEDEESYTKFITLVLNQGKAVPNYYGLPYINHHFGDTQIICRLGKNTEGDGLQFVGCDTHGDSRSIWDLRIKDKFSNNDEEDPTRVKLLVHDLDGNNMLAVDVVNGDILPSFKKDEVIQLQMVAFAESADFYPDEEAYAATVEPGPNGKKTMIGTNTIFPIGMFSDDEEVKDVVQINGIIKHIFLGNNKFGEQELKTNIRCVVDTQMGELEIIIPLGDAEEAAKRENMEPGRLINCFARLSGDAAINEHTEGIVRDAENNLKLVAYSFETGDPERLRTALSKDFVYYSEVSGRRFENADEFIEFNKMVRTEGVPTHTYYATVERIVNNGREEPEYTIGTRCIALNYEGESGINCLIFVDTDEEGYISRIHLVQGGGYHFRIDNPFPEKENLADLLANTTYKSSMIGRAHYHSLVDDDTGEEEMDAFLDEHRAELEEELADLFEQESSEDVFAEAFLRGVRKSAVPADQYDREDIISLGKQFHKDATLFKTEEEQGKIFHDALMLAAAIGRLYKGRADQAEKPYWKLPDDDPAEIPDEDTRSKRRQFNILMALKQGYETGDFRNVAPYLTEDTVFESEWVLKDLTGRDAIMEYLTGKGKTLKENNAFPTGDFIATPEGPILRLTQQDGNDKTALIVQLDDEGLAKRIGMFDIRLLVELEGGEDEE